MPPQRPEDIPTELLLRTFLLNYTRSQEREERREERREQVVREQNDSISRVSTEVLRLGGVVNTLEAKVTGKIDSVEEEIRRLKQDVAGAQTEVEDVAEKTGRHDIDLIKAAKEQLEIELAKKDQELVEIARSRKGWVKLIATAAFALISGAGVAWIGLHMKACEPRPAQASPTLMNTALAKEK